MTSTGILPSVGPPPPNMRRPSVPEGLKPNIPDRAEELSRDRFSHAGHKHSDKQERPITGGEQSKGTNVGVAVQVLEGQQPISARSAAGDRGSNRVSPAPSATLRVEERPSSSENTKLAGELSPEEEAHVAELKARDREVRAHEAAHANTGSGYTGRPNFEFVTGPDGVQYAVGGHVSIDTSTVPDDPAATISKMEVVRRAALAPARPSGQDRAVAAAAEQALREAQADLREQQSEEQAELSGVESNDDSKQLGEGFASIGVSDEHADQGIRPPVVEPTQINIDLIA